MAVIYVSLLLQKVFEMLRIVTSIMLYRLHMGRSSKHQLFY